ncbi:MAG: hypothetical protein OHK0048_21810 [Rhodoferax sp.]
MSDLPNPAQQPASEHNTGGSPGATLRQAREAVGLTVQGLAGMLKIPSAKLQALEQDDWSALGDPVFVRSLAQSVCRLTKIDPAPVLAGLPQRPSIALGTEAQRPRAVYAPGRRVSLRSVLGRPAILTGMALALAIAAVLLWPIPTPKESSTATHGSGISTGSSAASESGSSAFSSRPQEAASAAVLPGSASAMAPALKEELVLGAGSSTGPAVAAPVEPSPTASQTVERGLRISATGDAWVEVLDAQGSVLQRRLFKAGESSTVSVTKPFRLTVGRADLVSVSLDGQALDLTAHSKNNVARLEVK